MKRSVVDVYLFVVVVGAVVFVGVVVVVVNVFLPVFLFVNSTVIEFFPDFVEGRTCHLLILKKMCQFKVLVMYRIGSVMRANQGPIDRFGVM